MWPLAALVESLRSQYVDRLADFPNGVFDERASGWYRRFDPSYYDRRANVQERGNKHPLTLLPAGSPAGFRFGRFEGWPRGFRQCGLSDTLSRFWGEMFRPGRLPWTPLFKGFKTWGGGSTMLS